MLVTASPTLAVVTETPARRPLRSVDSSEWSDPRTKKGELFRSTHDGDDDETPWGVTIPSFLQPLLGMDFVPYLLPADKRHRSVTESSSSGGDATIIEALDTPTMIEGDLIGDDLVDHVCGSQHEDDDDHEDADEEPTYNDDNDEPFTGRLIQSSDTSIPAISPSGRVSRKQKIKKAIGRRIQKLKDKQQLRRTTSNGGSTTASPNTSWHGESTSSTTSGGGDETFMMQWIQQQHLALADHQEKLSKIQIESQQAKQRADKIERRIGSVRYEATQLQQALERSMTQLQTELNRLHRTVSDLDRLENEAASAEIHMEELTCIIRKGLVSTQPQQQQQSFEMSPRILRRVRSHTDDWSRNRNKQKRPPLNPQMSLDSADSSKQQQLLPSPLSSAQYRRRANTEPRVLRRSRSSSFMRVSDLNSDSSGGVLPQSADHAGSTLPTTKSQRSIEGHSLQEEMALYEADFFSIDDNVGLLLDKLFRMGWNVATDESDRFKPLYDTKRILGKYRCQSSAADWPVLNWQSIHKTDEVLVWTGGVPHKGFGHDWPVVKARGVVQASSRDVLDFLLDSSQLKRYNKMSQGRYDLLVLQKGVDTTAQESPYGFAGEARIMRALNKPKLLPKTIEVLSLWYAKPLLDAPPGSYMIVNRSVWENKSGTPPPPSSETQGLLRSEMLLGVFLVRPIVNDNAGKQCCELTTITHVYSPGVPELLAKRMAPNNAVNMVKEIQSLFPRTT